MRTIVLAPDDEIGVPWICVVVEHPTGVRYHQQYGGTACLQAAVEGYVVPVDFGAAAFAALDRLFRVDLVGAGAGPRPDPEVVERVRAVVDRLTYEAVVDGGWLRRRVRLDDGRVGELDEAWVPVVTDDGPGYLAWPNSD